jgi:heptosyltransferase-1
VNERRILVIRLSAMGDVIHALPAVASLRQGFPDAKISWLIKPRWSLLLAGNPSIDEVIPFERTVRGIRSVVQRLRKERFDLAVDFQGLMQSALLARAARASRCVGFHRSHAREPVAAFLYTTEVRTTSLHRVDQCLELAAAAGGAAIQPTFPLPRGEAEGHLPDEPFVLACPLAGWGSKQWPLEYYSQLAHGLDMPLVVNGPPESAGLLASIRGATIHRSGLPGLIDATRRAHAVIGVDSGPLHLAAALAKPGVAIFGPTDPASHGPYGASIRVLRSSAAVTSYKRRDEVDHAMRAIEPQAVLDALQASLAEA